MHILNKITNKVQNKNNAIDVLKCNGTNVTDGKLICNILNEHFCTISIKIASMQSKTGNTYAILNERSTTELMLN